MSDLDKLETEIYRSDGGYQGDSLGIYGKRDRTAYWRGFKREQREQMTEKERSEIRRKDRERKRKDLEF